MVFAKGCGFPLGIGSVAVIRRAGISIRRMGTERLIAEMSLNWRVAGVRRALFMARRGLVFSTVVERVGSIVSKNMVNG